MEPRFKPLEEIEKWHTKRILAYFKKNVRGTYHFLMRHHAEYTRIFDLDGSETLSEEEKRDIAEWKEVEDAYNGIKKILASRENVD